MQGFDDISSGLFSSKSGRIDTAPQPYPKEFRDDVIRSALGRDKDTTIAQTAKDFGIHEGTIAKWLRQADIDAGNKPARPRTNPPNCGSCDVALACLDRRF